MAAVSDTSISGRADDTSIAGKTERSDGLTLRCGLGGGRLRALHPGQTHCNLLEQALDVVSSLCRSFHEHDVQLGGFGGSFFVGYLSIEGEGEGVSRGGTARRRE